ncbi:MAG: effector binding domain-containing protein [Chlamydiales bacterium]
MKRIIAIIILLPLLCFAKAADHPFDYNLHLCSFPGSNGRTMVCMHGYGGNYRIAKILKDLGVTDATLVSFNFPDHGMREWRDDVEKATFGTIKELLPALYVIKKHVIDEGLESIDLYGFSAGGGALVNLLAALNDTRYDEELKKIGIANQEKTKIVQAIQKGIVILDTPLKSLEEIIAFRGHSPELELVARNYQNNQLRPIDSLERLKGLSLNVIVHFQEKDETLYNRDDILFLDRLKQANAAGKTSVVIGNDGGHNAPHFSLWRCYSQILQGEPGMTYVKEKQTKKLVIGIAIKTANARFQKEVPPLWEKFFREKIADRIPNKSNQNLVAVYTDYEGDHTQPFTYVIGCEVSSLKEIPEGMRGVEISPSPYAIFTARGDFPKSMLETWKSIWKTDLPRAYTSDFEIYHPDFTSQKKPEVKVFIALEK